MQVIQATQAHRCMFKDVVFVLTGRSMADHGDLVRATVAELLPGAYLRVGARREDIGDTGQVDLIVAPQVPWLPDLVRACPELKWLHLLSAGAERVFEWGLHTQVHWISKSSGVNAAAVAEYVLAALLHLTKGFGVFHDQQRSRIWKRLWLCEMGGCRLTVMGLGPVGIEVARRAQALGIRVTGVTRRGTPVNGIDQVFPSDALLDAVSRAEALAVVAPLTAETRGVVGEEVFSAMQRGALLVDASRGGITDIDALVRSLENGQLGGAVLDVFEKEPLPERSPLWDAPNLLITPHVAGTTDRFMARALQLFRENLDCLRETGQPLTRVDSKAGY